MTGDVSDLVDARARNPRASAPGAWRRAPSVSQLVCRYQSCRAAVIPRLSPSLISHDVQDVVQSLAHRSVADDSTEAAGTDASRRDQRMSPMSCARCMRTTLASASDASLRRWAVRSISSGLWRVEPQPDERHRGGLGNLFNDAPVGRPRIDRIDDDAVACTKDECGLFCQGGVHALGHVRRVSFRTEALQERDTAQTLPRLVAAQHHRTRDGTDRWCKTERQCRLPRARETSNRHEARMRRMQ